ncbi:dihydrodipicolinate synthase family protein [Nocardia sp. NPDC057227]|uniref:dihydrodipicolinate synthase family protein n=1 Tax=Nocardia sp. NPDC057227 TaxID=3346056 RepID=UPI0036363855
MSIPVPSPVVAALTPFQRSGTVDPAALRDQLHLLTAAGVRALLVNGTTGEFAACTDAERRTVLELCRAAWPGTLIAHIGGGPIGDVLARAEHAHDHADLLAVITPFFHADPPRTGVEEYLRRVLAGLRLPTLLYSFPRHTRTPLAPESLAQLAAEFPEVVAGIKDSGKDRAVSAEYKSRCPQLAVLLGDDGVGARIRELGLDGVVSGAGGPVAELPVAIAAAVAVGDGAEADRLQRVFDRYGACRRALPLIDIAVAKAALAERLPGFARAVRPPLTAADAEQTRTIGAVVRTVLA